MAKYIIYVQNIKIILGMVWFKITYKFIIGGFIIFLLNIQIEKQGQYDKISQLIITVFLTFFGGIFASMIVSVLIYILIIKNKLRHKKEGEKDEFIRREVAEFISKSKL